MNKNECNYCNTVGLGGVTVNSRMQEWDKECEVQGLWCSRSLYLFDSHYDNTTTQHTLHPPSLPSPSLPLRPPPPSPHPYHIPFSTSSPLPLSSTLITSHTLLQEQQSHLQSLITFCNTVLYSTNCIVQHYTVLYCTVIHYAAL